MKKLSFLLVLLGLAINVQSQNIFFPDANFKAKLLQSHTIDSDSDNEISIAEAGAYVNMLSLENSNISDLSGIEYFTNISHLDCSDNQLTSINLSGLTELYNLDCENNQITILNLSNLPALLNIYCKNNALTYLSIYDLPNLVGISCQSNQLDTLDLSNLPDLNVIYCQDNDLTALTISNCPNVTDLHCQNNNFTYLSLPLLPHLTELRCENNQLISLDCSYLTGLTNLSCYLNPLTTLLVKNGRNEHIVFHATPNLQYVCADESQIADIQSQLSMLGLSNSHVNSYCSFAPGAAFYAIQGGSKYDYDSNGCTVSDLLYPNLKYNISDGSVSGSVFSNGSGNFFIPVQAATHTLTPVIENPSYFAVSPTSATVTFPAQSSPFTQEFCITPNGVHPDLEITLIPLSVARPGFDSSYKVLIKNKGTHTQSGTATFSFDDTLSDFVSATPVHSNQAVNTVSWDFSNLLPFESRTFEVVLNLNSPIESPALNDGDTLGFYAAITSAATDDSPQDNTMEIIQNVFNSFDPNDKTCLQGEIIDESAVGKYVHYKIRFENTGTFDAENIVVKDMIDSAKFDISTLVPVTASHSFETKISGGNKVEFIFENINLPFDDANNDGYIVFKIKTLGTLHSGDTFSNTAQIYFDFNAPITTNTEVTSIVALTNSDFEIGQYLTLYPNPVKNTLNIETKGSLEVYSFSIYNTLGQLLQVIPNAQSLKNIDVSNLSAGNYFLKTTTDKGTSTTKFIKN